MKVEYVDNVGSICGNILIKAENEIDAQFLKIFTHYPQQIGENGNIRVLNMGLEGQKTGVQSMLLGYPKPLVSNDAV